MRRRETAIRNAAFDSADFAERYPTEDDLLRRILEDLVAVIDDYELVYGHIPSVHREAKELLDRQLAEA